MGLILEDADTGF